MADLRDLLEGKPDPRVMEKWAMVRRLRDLLPQGHVSQPLLAEMDRELFARDVVAENPLRAPGMLGMAFWDYLAKKVDPDRGRSPATLNQVLASKQGIAGGVEDWGRSVLSRIPGNR